MMLLRACSGRNELGITTGITLEAAKTYCSSIGSCTSFERFPSGTFKFSNSCIESNSVVSTIDLTDLFIKESTDSEETWHNDIWFSESDAKCWTLAKDDANRAVDGYLGASLVTVPFDGVEALLLLGGQTKAGVYLNTIQLSLDGGFIWSVVAGTAGWSGRDRFAAIVDMVSSRLLVWGGEGTNPAYKADLWSTSIQPVFNTTGLSWGTYTTRAATPVVWGSATSLNQLTEGIAPVKHRFTFTLSANGVLSTGTAGAADVSDTITITASLAIWVAAKLPVCTVAVGSTTATLMAATSSATIMTLTVASNTLAASTQQTIECATGDGSILAGTSAAAIAFSIVTTQDTTALTGQSGFTIRTATQATFISATASNQLRAGLLV
jgi:hypothetical protein